MASRSLRSAAGVFSAATAVASLEASSTAWTSAANLRRLAYRTAVAAAPRKAQTAADVASGSGAARFAPVMEDTALLMHPDQPLHHELGEVPPPVADRAADAAHPQTGTSRPRSTIVIGRLTT